MRDRLVAILHGISSRPLARLAEGFLKDEEFMAKFCRAPAGMKNHHAYRGGLLEHVLSLMELVLVVAPRYAQLDGDKLLIGAFLHDAAKVDELSYERDIAYTDEGQLLGHMVLGVTMLNDKVRQIVQQDGQPFPDRLLVELKHMIVSHHGEYEYGSSKLPMTLEAIALHYLDNLDAKLAPRQLRRVTFGEHANLVTIDDHMIAVDRYATRKSAMRRIAPRQMGVRVGITQIINSDDLDLGALVTFVQRAQYVATDASVTINAYLNCH